MYINIDLVIEGLTMEEIEKILDFVTFIVEAKSGEIAGGAVEVEHDEEELG